MLALQGFRYALHRSSSAEAQFRRFAGARRFVWNKALAYQLEARGRGDPIPRYAAVCKRLTGWKIEHPWLCEIHSQVLQHQKTSTAHGQSASFGDNQWRCIRCRRRRSVIPAWCW